MAHHSTRLENPYQLQYGAPPTLPTWDWATATKSPLPLPKVTPYSSWFHKSSNSGESSSCSCSFLIAVKVQHLGHFLSGLVGYGDD